MSTPDQVTELRERFTAMQSGGAKVLSNASLALRVLDAMGADEPAEPEPEPAPEPSPEPVPDPVPTGALGLPAGAALTPHPGGTISQSDVVLDGVLIDGDVTITGSRVHLVRSRVTGHAIARQGADIVIEDSNIGSWVSSGAVRPVLRRVRLTGTTGKDAMHVTANPTTAGGRSRDVLIEDVEAIADYDAIVGSGNHYDSIQARGVVGLTVRRVRLDQGAVASSRFNATVFVEEANGGNEDVLIEGCWLRSAGYYNLRIGSPGVVVRDNVLARPWTSGGQTWNTALIGSSQPLAASGNTWDDGTPLDL